MSDCIFCNIVAGEAPSHKIWEDEDHLAFLTIFPNTPGFTVVITKQHHPSYAFDNADAVLIGLVLASKKVAKKIDAAFEDVGRTGLMFEGFGVDHLHAKLFPMHGTKSDAWKQHRSHVDTFFQQYEGYMSSHDSKRADDAELSKIAKKINSSK
jgi:diadenosine tetraphosphate (Ap4A) HIT family hydrolase